MSEYESKEKRYKVNDTAWIIPLSIYLAINLSGFFAIRLIFALFISLNITFITWAPPFIGLFSLIALFALVLLIIGAVSKAKSRNSDTISKGLLIANQFFAVALVVLLVIALVAYIVIVAIYSSSIRSVIPESIVNIIIIALLLALAGIHSYYLLKLKPVEGKYIEKREEQKEEEQKEEKQKTKAEIIVKTGKEVEVLDISAGGEIKEKKELEELRGSEKEQQSIEGPSEEELEKEHERMPESKKKREKREKHEKEKHEPEKPEPKPGEKSTKIKCKEEEGEGEDIMTLRINAEEGL